MSLELVLLRGDLLALGAGALLFFLEDGGRGLLGRLNLFSLVGKDAAGTLLGLASSTGEQHQLGEVGLKTSDVALDGLDGLVGAAVINGDADGGSESGVDLSLGKLAEREALAELLLAGVLESALGDEGLKTANRTREVGLSQIAALRDAAQLASGLVEPGLDPLLPMLAQVGALDGVVMARHIAL